MKFTLGIDSATIIKLNGFRRKRSNITYDTAGTTSESEVGTLLEIANELYTQIKKWLKANHPNLY